MGKVVVAAAMSLDGYIAGPDETGMERLFEWFAGGPIAIPTTNPDVTFFMSEPDARWFNGFNERVGCFVAGRRLFDLGGGWDGVHPMGKPVVIVTHNVPHDFIATHPNAPFTFVTEGVAAAIEIAREIAGDKDVDVASGKISSQALAIGLVDEVLIDLAPVLLGGGVPFFEPSAAPIVLDGPTEVVQGERITHLRYIVRKTGVTT